MPKVFTEADIHTVDIFDEVYLAVTIPSSDPGCLLYIGDAPPGEPPAGGWQPPYGPPVTSVINLRQDFALPPGWDWPDDPELIAQREGIEIALIHKCGTPAQIFQAEDFDEIELAPGVYASPGFPGVKELLREGKRQQFDDIIAEVAQNVVEGKPEG